jgi:protease-4
MTPSHVIDNLAFGDSGAVRAVVLRIDSPGGGVVPTQEIYAEIERLKKRKLVFASMGAWPRRAAIISRARTQIVASPGTLTGLIGAIRSWATWKS